MKNPTGHIRRNKHLTFPTATLGDQGAMPSKSREKLFPVYNSVPNLPIKC